MITSLDDFPIHQTVDPIAFTASSDRYTYDRYWYNGHSRDGDVYFGVAMGRYPNLGIVDCSFSVVVDGRQHAFFASRRAPVDPAETQVGPFQLKILEPMGRHRLVIAANDTGIECDLIFTPKTAAIQEGRQTQRNERHLIQDVTRFDQFGSWEGVIRVNGTEIPVLKADTFGLKDRSWGIRQVGERFKGGAPLQHQHEGTHFMWAPIHWSDRCTLVGWYENSSGHQWHADQVITPVYAEQSQIPVGTDPAVALWKGRVEHKFDYQPGTRRAETATITMNNVTGESLEICLQPQVLFRMKGIGYQHPIWGHGFWKGELAIGSESWSNDELDPLTWDNLHIQQLVIARCGDEVGYGVLEQMHIGPYQPYGFKEWFDGAA